jgi:chromosome segregation ATPase
MPSPEVLTALEKLKTELSEIEPAIRHIELAAKVASTVKDIPRRHLELLAELKKADVLHKSELKTAFGSELSHLTGESRKIAQSTAELQQGIQSELETLAAVRESVKTFHDRVERINFPERLDKLDTTVSGIMLAIQSVQQRLESIERNVLDRLKENAERQREGQVALQQNLEKGFRQQRVATYVTWAIIVLAALVLVLLKRIL